MRTIIHSGVLIDYLEGLDEAKQELERYSKREISIVSWIEIMTGPDTPEEIKATREFLATCTVHPLSIEIANEAVKIRKEFRLRLPDAIIWATARTNGCLLVTRNTKDFPIKEPSVRIPYTAKP